jgi:hypothetical protein
VLSHPFRSVDDNLKLFLDRRGVKLRRFFLFTVVRNSDYRVGPEINDEAFTSREHRILAPFHSCASDVLATQSATRCHALQQ